MRVSRGKVAIALLGAALTLAGIAARPARAQDAATPGTITLYVDQRTGQVFNRPGKGRMKLGSYVPSGAVNAAEIERSVEQKAEEQIKTTQAQMRAEFDQKSSQQQQWNAEMAKQVSEMRPAWQEFGDRWFKKISIGTLVYAYYGLWTHTGFGPQFMDANMQWPGVYNNYFNEFAINRTYLDFKFTPNEDFLMRITPDMYAMINTGTKCTNSATTTSVTVPVKGTKYSIPVPAESCTASSGDVVGNNTGWAQNVDGNLGLRLKYAYLDYNTLFQKVLPVEQLREDKVTFGQQQNPLVDWEENLWGFRYTALTPWNYLSLSSAQVGLAFKGPIKFNETQYADYDFGVYDDASFHAIEQSNYKQAMARLTVNPLGAKSRYDSLGITYFYDYGYPNKAADVQEGPSSLTKSITAPDAHMMRMSVLIHYNARAADFAGWGWGIIGEWDYGQNAFSTGNLFSGSGPSDAVGVSSAGGFFTPWNKMVGALLGTGQTHQMGWDVLGHLDIAGTPFTIFGLWEAFQPNTQGQIKKNPLDFYRYDLGLQYVINKNLRLAFTAQEINYYHSQFTFPTTVVGSTTVPETPFAVPHDTHAFFLNLEFKY
ncbi:MAG TPA: hypothetical protein VEC38_00635 [Candidatus Binataceae bacterium]|nr:hypothetical protein [Candidatus Binataceae bacterium]